jgi:eukaryotic-like serine/threonine-protein kinase
VNAEFGRYRLLERLGRGGMAEVFKAKSFGVEGFEKILVIKRILPELARSQEFTEMFIHEAKLAVRLSHANIVQVFDLGIASLPEPHVGLSGGMLGAGVSRAPASFYFMAMEFVHGCDLATLLARCRKQQITLPIDMCVVIAAEVAKGLDHAHRRRDEQMRPLNIVHRDVSPQNVLLSFEGEVKVTDFGIAKARGAFDANTQDDTRARKLQGKYGYMSPEQARGESVDARSDLFSLGTILYECLAGVNPFSAPTTFETLRRVQACEFPPVLLLRPDVPAELVGILQMAMAKDPESRFADAGRMYEAMLAFLYAHGSRSGANEIAEFLARFRTTDELSVTRSHERISILERFDADSVAHLPQLTPVEVPVARHQSSIPHMISGAHVVAMERAAEMGERREITALAVELPERESRGASDRRDRVIAIVNRYGGRVFRQDPEQVVALFGLDDPDGRDTEIATRCALVAVRAIAGPRQASAGLHTSRVHVARSGEPTDDDRLAGLVSTARDLARVREGRVALSPAAARHVSGGFSVEPLGDPDATGIGAGSLVKDVRGPAETFGRFVGRKDELRKIGEILAASTRRSARLLTLRGEHGVGKTRLLYEVERRLRKGGYNVGLHIAACPPRGRELPLSGIVAMLHVLCGVTEGDSSERIADVQPRLRALGLSSEEVTTVLAALGASVVAPVGNAKTVLRSAFARMLASLSEDRPHTFAWDPGDCMDDASFEILGSAFARLTTSRVVFAFTARAGFTHALEKLDAHTGLDLTDLAPEDAVRLIGLRLGIETVPDELARFVRERASGHPQFIEEVLKGLVDARAVTVAEKRVVSMKLLGQDLALPKTLRGLVASRVARLVPEDRTTLQAASVLGDTVDVAVLAQMLGRPIGLLEKVLGTLKQRDFLVHTGPSELRFTSPIVREVVADALTIEASREMHAAAGHALETVLAEHAWEQAARIATHYYESGNRERAAYYFARSGERRLEARQLEGAARDYSRALELSNLDLRPPEELANWLAGLAEARGGADVRACCRPCRCRREPRASCAGSRARGAHPWRAQFVRRRARALFGGRARGSWQRRSRETGALGRGGAFGAAGRFQTCAHVAHAYSADPRHVVGRP